MKNEKEKLVLFLCLESRLWNTFDVFLPFLTISHFRTMGLLGFGELLRIPHPTARAFLGHSTVYVINTLL